MHRGLARGAASPLSLPTADTKKTLSTVRTLPMIPARLVIMHLLAALLLISAAAAPADEAALRNANAFRDSGDLRAAEITLKDLLQGDPSNAQARILLGMVYLDSGDGAAAEQAFERAMLAGVPRQSLLEPLGEAFLLQGRFRALLDEIIPSGVADKRQKAAIYALRGDAYLALEQRDDAERAFGAALGLVPTDERALLGNARIARQRQEPDEARRLIQAVLDVAPTSPKALEALGDLEYSLGRNTEGEAAFTAALGQTPRTLELHQKRALLRLKAGDLEGAREDIQAAETQKPEWVGLLYPRGLLLFREERLDEALVQLQDLLRATPEHPMGIYYTGATLLLLRRHQEAEEYLSRFQRLAPGSEMGALLLGRNRLASGNPAAAETVLLPFAAREDAGSEVLLLTSQALSGQGRSAEAAELLRRLVAREPNDPDARLALAEKLILAGDREAASEELDALVAMDNGNQGARLLLLKMHLEQRDHAAALAAADDFLALYPGDAAAYSGRGLALVLAGDEAGAREAFTAALQTQPGFWDAANNLARLEIAAARTEVARKLYEGVLEQDPAHANAALALAKLDLVAGDSDAATQRLESALKVDPNALTVRLMLVKYHLENDEPADALSLMEESPGDLEGNPGFLLWRGRVEYANGRYGNAANTFELLARLQPRSPVPRFLLAESQAAAGYVAAMQDAMIDGLELDPVHPQSGTVMRKVMAATPNLKSKRYLLARFRSVAPDHPELELLAGEVAFLGRDWAEAIEVFGKSYRDAPQERDRFLRLYQAQIKGSRQVDAVKLAEEWLNRHPDDAAVWVALGEIHRNRRDLDAAVQAYGNALAVAPDNLAALNNLSMLLLDDDPTRALEVAERAHKIAPENPAISDTLGTALLRNGELERAATILGEAHKGLPGDASVTYHYASALAQIGRGAEAGKILKLLKFQRANFPEKAQADALLESLSK